MAGAGQAATQENVKRNKTDVTQVILCIILIALALIRLNYKLDKRSYIKKNYFYTVKTI